MATTAQEKNYSFYIQTDMSSYIGEWVAVLGDRVIAHGKNIKEVVKIAQGLSKGKKFLLARVPDQEAMIF